MRGICCRDPTAVGDLVDFGGLESTVKDRRNARYIRWLAASL
jgi:hypothetical protein